jgi:hypothetical protein
MIVGETVMSVEAAYQRSRMEALTMSTNYNKRTRSNAN